MPYLFDKVCNNELGEVKADIAKLIGMVTVIANQLPKTPYDKAATVAIHKIIIQIDRW